MLWSVYWHVQQTKRVEGFPGHVSCCGGRINMCRPDGSCWFGVGGATLGLLIVCGPRLMVMCALAWAPTVPPTTLSARGFIM